ncbi:hypothetical protein E3P81_04073 [Wallemia ichthyophaga]|nr:hypothetical protein E3P97_04082 [Wallemia ichthyophaga]TIB27784.1 hypothetical protein E3P85_04070 [Wallemia ichthyophaga]TIB43160.1 hypothetical protein E3P82_04081 [Wallemia ichthyophaga]TIB45330.1 hypothetical protein E3P81_04073 [Wallemia ichthyophaga]TIB47169.1 hypothetical protein E3P80_04085 [Wallemia ichthyophaga]
MTTTRDQGDADDAYIIRSEQKDAYHLAQLASLAEPVARGVLGSRFMDTRGGSISVALLTIYTAITTGFGRRTLGEEYTNVQQWKGHKMLSWQMRALLVLSIPAPHILKYLIGRSGVISRLSPALRRLLSILSSSTTWDIARTLNLIAFYCGSKYHTIKQRIFQIRYIDTSPATQQHTDKPFEVLGYMLCVRLALQLGALAKPYLPQVPLGAVEVPAVEMDGRRTPTRALLLGIEKWRTGLDTESARCVWKTAQRRQQCFADICIAGAVWIAGSEKRPDLLAHYMSLDQGDSIQAEYIWIDGDGELRSKTTTVNHKVESIQELKEWNFDGSSTNQAPGHDSDIYLRPAAFFRDPFRKGNNILVIAECYNSDGTPNKTNYRHYAKKAMDLAKDEDPWFGIEQEYTLFDADGSPYGWPKGGFPAPQGPYYCGVGAGKVFARDLIESHYRACLYAGVNISGINAEVMPSQWEYQVGPCAGIDMGDHLTLARFLLARIAEDFGIVVSLHPKPFATGEWNGAGAHTNLSTTSTRTPGKGMKAIEDMIMKLEKKHAEHIAAYGDDNELRLTGKHETGNIADFSSGVANRGCSIRVPRHVAEQGYGYFEDRRPASNIDPYRVTGLCVNTMLLD